MSWGAPRTDDGVALACSVLLGSGVWLVSRELTRLSRSRERAVASFAGGVSLAFVVLELFVELVEGALDIDHVAPFGSMRKTALVMLAGAALPLAAQAYNARREVSGRSYAIALGPQLLYGALIGAALDGELHESWWQFAVFWFAMVLHIGVATHRLATRFPREHVGRWRVLAAAAPVMGAALWMLIEPGRVAFQLLLALVGGTTVLTIFREEIPQPREVRLGAFFAGVVVFAALEQIRWWF